MSLQATAEELPEPIVPREDQLEARQAIRNAREQGLPRVLIEAATGLGKMVIAGLAAEDQYEHYDAEGRGLFVTHRSLITEHARRTFGRMLPEDISYGDIYGSSLDLDAQWTFALYQKLTRGSAGPRFAQMRPDAYAIGIGDESHHAAATTYRRVHEHFQPEIFINFSATPYRHDGRNTLDITGPVIYRKTLPEGLADGLLTPVRYKLYSDELVSKGLLSHGFETLTMNQLNRAVFVPRRDEEVVEILKQEASVIDEPRGLIYCSSIEHAERMAPLLEEALGVSTKAIHSHLNDDKQRQYREDFKTGVIKLATVVDQFNEGADYPDLNLLAFLRSTSSEMIWLQQLGRGLRRAPGKKMVTVVDLAGTIDRIGMVANIVDRVEKLHKLSHTRHRISVEKDPPFDFKFTGQTADIVELFYKVRNQTKNRQQDLGPWRDLKLPDTPLQLDLPFNRAKQKTVDIPPFVALALHQIWQSPHGSVDTKFLQKAHQHVMQERLPNYKLDALLEGVVKGGVISPSAFRVGEYKGENMRLTSPGIEALSNIPGFKASHKTAVDGIRKLMKGYSTQIAVRGTKGPRHGRLGRRGETTYQFEDVVLPIHIYNVKETLNKTDFKDTDLTDAEMDVIYKKWQALRKANKMNHFVTVSYHIGAGAVLATLTVTEHMGGGAGVTVGRFLAPGEIGALTETLKGLPITATP